MRLDGWLDATLIAVILLVTLAVVVFAQCPPGVLAVNGHNAIYVEQRLNGRRAAVRGHFPPCLSGPEVTHPDFAYGPPPIEARLIACRTFDIDCDGDVDLRDYAREKPWRSINRSGALADRSCKN